MTYRDSSTIAILLAALTFGVTGCDRQINIDLVQQAASTPKGSSQSWHAKNGWIADKFFTDPKVIELCRAIETNDLPAIRRAIEQGADVNALGKDNMTPLLWAFPENHVERMKILLEAGADPNVIVTSDLGVPGLFVGGDSVSHMAARSVFEYFDLVFDHGGDPELPGWIDHNPAIFSIIKAGILTEEKKKRIAKLIDSGFDINQPGSEYSGGSTPLMQAITFAGQYDLALFLLANGANPYQYGGSRGISQIGHLLAHARNSSFLKITSQEHRDQFEKLVVFLETKGVFVDDYAVDQERRKATSGVGEPLCLAVFDAIKRRNGLVDRVPKLADGFLKDFSVKIGNRFDEYTFYKWVELEFQDQDGMPKSVRVGDFPVETFDRFHSDFVAIKWAQKGEFADVVFIDIAIATEVQKDGQPASSNLRSARQIPRFRVAADRVGSSASIAGYINRDTLPASTVIDKFSWMTIVADYEATAIESVTTSEAAK